MEILGMSGPPGSFGNGPSLGMGGMRPGQMRQPRPRFSQLPTLVAPSATSAALATDAECPPAQSVAADWLTAIRLLAAGVMIGCIDNGNLHVGGSCVSPDSVLVATAFTLSGG